MTPAKLAFGVLKIGVRWGLALLDAVLSPPLSRFDEIEKRRAEKRRQAALRAANRVGRR